jgi:beta-phosphoglucomutase-like phosphatase (HAD superfamily)
VLARHPCYNGPGQGIIGSGEEATIRVGKGIIFDLNGVLWLDGPLQEQAWAQFSAELRGWPLSPGEMARHVHGRNNRHTLEYLLARSLAEGELERLSEQKEAGYRRLCLAEGASFCLSPGAAPLLDWLAAHRVPRAIATSSGQGNVGFFRQHLGLDRWFAAGAIVYDDGTLPGKPAPDLYCRAARVLGLPPPCCVVVEDSLSGLEAARAAGIGQVVALGPPGEHATLAAIPGVSLVVASLAQLAAGELFL